MKKKKLTAAAKTLKENQVEVSNIDTDILFDPNNLKEFYKEMLSRKETIDTEVMEYLFREHLEVAKEFKA